MYQGQTVTEIVTGKPVGAAAQWAVEKPRDEVLRIWPSA